MRGAVINAVGRIGVDKGILAGDTVGDCDLADPAAFGNIEPWLLIIRLNGLDPAGIGVALSIDLIPDAVVWITRFTILVDGADLEDLIGAEVMDLVCLKGSRVVQRDAAPGDAPLFGLLGGQGAAGYAGLSMQKPGNLH